MANDSYRQSLVEAHQKSSDAYDKAIMTLAGGGLAISITFVHEVAPHPVHKGWLAWSWGLLALSLGLIFLSFLASQYAISRRIKEWDKHPVWGWNVPGWMTATLNLLSGGAFIAGVVCLVRFAWFNI
jgi:hypothetical protein